MLIFVQTVLQPFCTTARFVCKEQLSLCMS